MMTKQKTSIQSQDFLFENMIRFLELNMKAIDERTCQLAVRFYKGESLEDIATSEQLTPQRIGQLVRKAETQIKHYINSSELSNVKDKVKSLQDDYEALKAENEALRVTLKVNNVDEVTSLSKLELSTRTINVLENMGVNSVEVLCKKSVIDILVQKNAGTKTISEIENALAKYNLRLE